MPSDWFGRENIRDYYRLLKAQDRETRCLASLATGRRISQRSSYDTSPAVRTDHATIDQGVTGPSGA